MEQKYQHPYFLNIFSLSDSLHGASGRAGAQPTAGMELAKEKTHPKALWI